MVVAWMEVENSLEPAIGAFTRLKDYLSDPEVWGGWLVTFIQIAIALAIGRILANVAKKALTHMMTEKRRSPLKMDHRRTQTIGKLLHNTVNYTINFVLILIVLGQFGINLGPVLAGAGVLGLAIGFGAQSLVKDVITGFFIIFEDQFGVGDVIQIGGFKGTVEEIGLRVTKLKSGNGEVHVIPNGTIQQVTNFSIYNSLAIVDVPVPGSTNLNLAMEILGNAIASAYEGNENMVRPPEVQGLQVLGAAENTIRITAECKPNTQGGVERDLKRVLKEALDQLKSAADSALA